MDSSVIIERLAHHASPADVTMLAELLVDAVDSGAAVTFAPGLTVAEAERWWQDTLRSAASDSCVLTARDDAGTIVGTVQYHVPAATNQRHRADVAKMLVHRRARGRGIGEALLVALEAAARSAGLRLLTLDTKRGDNAERLYRRHAWVEAGGIPGYAVNPDGSPHEAVFMYKVLR
jgi:acetyltransferase